MKELEIQAIEDLIKFYREYLDKGNTEEIKKRALILESKYAHCSPLAHKNILSAVGYLVYFYATNTPGKNLPDEEKTKEIIKSLEERKKELNK